MTIGTSAQRPVDLLKAKPGNLTQGNQRGFLVINQENATDAHPAKVWLIKDDRRLAEAVEGGDYLAQRLTLECQLAFRPGQQHAAVNGQNRANFSINDGRLLTCHQALRSHIAVGRPDFHDTLGNTDTGLLFPGLHGKAGADVADVMTSSHDFERSLRISGNVNGDLPLMKFDLALFLVEAEVQAGAWSEIKLTAIAEL